MEPLDFLDGRRVSDKVNPVSGSPSAAKMARQCVFAQSGSTAEGRFQNEHKDKDQKKSGKDSAQYLDSFEGEVLLP